MMNKEEGAFREYSRYYDLLYKDKDYRAEASYINRLLQQYVSGKCDIIEFGSGTGHHANILTNKYGHKIHGVEISAEMASNAREDENFTCVVGDMRVYDAQRTFDCALALFHVVSYLTSDSDVNLFLNNANRHLAIGGVLVFDVWFAECVNHVKPSTRVKRMQLDGLEVIRLAEPTSHPEDSVIDIDYSIFVKDNNDEKWSLVRERHSMRYFSLDEIHGFCESSGFELVQSEEFLTSSVPSDTTWGVCHILKKIKDKV